MPYRTTRRTAEARQRQVDAMARGREAARLAGPEREPVQALPMLRRVLIVIDYDSGQPVEHRIELYRTRRVDVYRATADGQDWGRRGWSAVLEGCARACRAGCRCGLCPATDMTTTPTPTDDAPVLPVLVLHR